MLRYTTLDNDQSKSIYGYYPETSQMKVRTSWSISYQQANEQVGLVEYV